MTLRVLRAYCENFTANVENKKSFFYEIILKQNICVIVFSESK